MGVQRFLDRPDWRSREETPNGQESHSSSLRPRSGWVLLLAASFSEEVRRALADAYPLAAAAMELVSAIKKGDTAGASQQTPNPLICEHTRSHLLYITVQ